MSRLELSYNTRKALCVHIGEAAGMEVATLLRKLAERIEALERNKVSITPIAPSGSENLLNVRIAQEEFD